MDIPSTKQIIAEAVEMSMRLKQGLYDIHDPWRLFDGDEHSRMCPLDSCGDPTEEEFEAYEEMLQRELNDSKGG